MLWLYFGICFGITFGPALGWDYTDDIDREWDVQDPRALPGISVTRYEEKATMLIKASSGFTSDYRILAKYSRYGRLTLDLAETINSNMTSYCDVVIKDTEDDFNAAYAAFTSSERILQVAYNELTDAEKEETSRTLGELTRREAPTSPEFEYEDIRSANDSSDNGYGYYYGSGSGDTETTEGPTEAPPEYDRRLWPEAWREEYVRNINLKDNVEELRSFLKKAYELRKMFEESVVEMKENMTIQNLVTGTQALEEMLTAADTRALLAYIGIHHFSTFGEAWAVYPEDGRDTLYALWYKLIHSTILAKTLDTGSWYPVKYWQDYLITDKPEANCSIADLSVVDCPLSYLKKHGVTAIDVKKFDPWLKTFNRARRIRVKEVSVRFGGAQINNKNGTAEDGKVTMEVFNVGVCKDYYLFEEHPFEASPVHIKYVYDQASYEKRLLKSVNPADNIYQARTTPFTKWLIVFDKVLNPDLDLSGVNDLRISWSGEVSLNPYP